LVSQPEDPGTARRSVGFLNKRLAGALIAYAVLIGAACVLLDGTIRLAVIGLFVALIAKTLIAWKAGW